MYLYFSHDDKTGVTNLIGLHPSTRGRPPKNHAEYGFGPFDFYSAIIAEDDSEKFDQLPELRIAIGKGDIPVRDRKGVIAVGDMIELATARITDVLAGLAASGSMDPAEENQVRAILPVLMTNLDTLTKTPKNTEAIEHICDVLSANLRLINRLLSPGGWFHKNSSEPTPAVPAAAANAGTDEPNPAESIRMATATDNFGFGRMTGSPTVAPTLKVHEDPTAHEDAEVNGVFLPKPDETYIINEQIARLFKLLQISRQNCPQNIRLVGPHGCGKTELAIQFAARLGLPLLIMDCANLREARDWFGQKSAKDGTVFWRESQFVRAVEAGNHVIVLDELNRANPHLLNTLMPLLDARRFTYLEERGTRICVGPGTVFFASMNEGAGYTGTSALDRAIRDRFPRVVELTYLNETDEISLLVNRVGVDKEIATRLVQMAQKIREDANGLSASLTESLSTRQLIAAAHDFAIGGVETLTFTISNHFSADGDDESERIRVQNIIQGKFGDMLAAAADKSAKSKKGA